MKITELKEPYEHVPLFDLNGSPIWETRKPNKKGYWKSKHNIVIKRGRAWKIGRSLELERKKKQSDW